MPAPSAVEVIRLGRIAILSLVECVKLDVDRTRDHLYRAAAEAIAAGVEMAAAGGVGVRIPPPTSKPGSRAEVLTAVQLARLRLRDLEQIDDDHLAWLAYEGAMNCLRAAMDHLAPGSWESPSTVN